MKYDPDQERINVAGLILRYLYGLIIPEGEIVTILIV
jgi:hypothetical protein